MKTVYMVQVAVRRWRLESKEGVVIQDDILAYTNWGAEDWVRRYVSSFTPVWHYQLKPQEKKND